MTATIIFWFRRDLRLNDNAGLYHALKEGTPVIPIFIYDKKILDKLEDKTDRRVSFIYEAVTKIQDQLVEQGSTLRTIYGTPAEVFTSLMNEHHITAVYANDDYEPYATSRDTAVAEILSSKNIDLIKIKDHVIFEKDEIVKDDGRPYTVFTPYSKKWLAKLSDFYVKSFPTEKYFKNFHQHKPLPQVMLEETGFSLSSKAFPSPDPDHDLLEKYDTTRNYPGLQGTSRLGVHLRFGTISIRQLASLAKTKNATYLNELIWRDFYQAILWHFPHVLQHAFKPAYDNIKWRNNEEEFALWCKGLTGYPIVDAGMREINETGFMHNRVRMIVASFLVKHLLIDWRWGEAYFAGKLLDFDAASNNGGWQWAAGSGCDAAPYFRIFNPYLQTKKFDPELNYIKKWVPEFQEFNYPKPVVDHEFARKRALQVFGEALKP